MTATCFLCLRLVCVWEEVGHTKLNYGSANTLSHSIFSGMFVGRRGEPRAKQVWLPKEIAISDHK